MGPPQTKLGLRLWQHRHPSLILPPWLAPLLSTPSAANPSAARTLGYGGEVVAALVHRDVAALAKHNLVGRLGGAVAADGAEGLVVGAALRKDVVQLLRL